MKIISHRKLSEFCEAYSDAEMSMMRWYTLAECTLWRNLADMKKDYPSTTRLGDYYIFKIPGKRKYRVVAKVYDEYLYILFAGDYKDWTFPSQADGSTVYLTPNGKKLGRPRGSKAEK